MTLTKASSEPTLRISRGSCLKSKQQAVTSSRRTGVKFLLATELKMNVPATTREDTLQSMNTRRRFKRRGFKSTSMLILDLAALSSEVPPVECAEGSTHTTESIIHQQEDHRKGLVSMREINESFSSLATYDTADSRTTDHFLRA
jgi:hypothetical protein